jgi:cytoskeletal protein CcmA (bactofilin family)
VLAPILFAALQGCGLHAASAEDVASKKLGRDYFGAGGSVNLTDPVAGDAFLAGGSVATAGEVRGDLLAVGGDVSIGGSVGDDIHAAGGDVKVDAIVSGNARLAGGDVSVGPATTIGGSLSMTGGQLDFLGDVQGDLRASGGEINVDGSVRGNAEVEAERVEIGPGTRIGGKLIVRSPSEPTVPSGAQIAGGVEYHQTDTPLSGQDDFEHGARGVAHGVGSFLWVLGVFIAGTLFTLAFPAYSARAADWIGREPLKSLALGFVILVCVPVLAVALLITIIGIPLAMVLMMLYVLLMFLGWVTAALYLCRKGLDLTRGTQPVSTGMRLGALLAAVLALWLLGKVPVVGGWVTLAALLLGIGALVWQGWPRRADPRLGAPA